jgi:hypothetical protein
LRGPSHARRLNQFGDRVNLTSATTCPSELPARHPFRVIRIFRGWKSKHNFLFAYIVVATALRRVLRFSFEFKTGWQTMAPMPDTMSTPPIIAPKKRGCLFYGCLTLAIAFVILGVLGFVGYQYARKSVGNLVENYTDSQPASLETVELSQEELDQLQERVSAFQQALDRQDKQQELVLSEREVNALIARDPNMKGKVQARIEGNRIRGQISWPLEDVGPLKLGGRYLNGLATLGVSLTNGQLAVVVDDVEVNGKPLPAPLMKELKKKNLAQEALKNPKTLENIEKFESIEVRDGKLILKNKVK